MVPSPLSSRSIALVLTFALLLTACGSSGQEATPTLSAEQIQTQAVASFAADLTSTALSRPTDTPTATESPTPAATGTQASTNTPAAAATAAEINPTASCYGLRFVSDVTIPDDTEMAPDEEFTKTWRVRNSGTCDWEEGFELGFTGGERMNGAAVELEGGVEPGEEEDVSVEMTAPEDEGTYRGNWRMRDASGNYFGDEVFVRIVVEEVEATATKAASATASATTAVASATPAPTETPAPTATPTESEES